MNAQNAFDNVRKRSVHSITAPAGAGQDNRIKQEL